MTGTRPLLVVDGTNLAVRAAKAVEHSPQPMTTVDGDPTGALVVFLNMLSRHVREEEPSGVVVCWDDPVREESWRRRMDPTYKANRTGSSTLGVPIVLAYEALHRMRGAGVEFLQDMRRGFEADDLVASYVVHRGERPAVILSGDKDLRQLICADVTQVSPTSQRGETDRWDVQRMLSHYGCKPPDLAMILALQGDTSDGIIGVRGVGPKKAVKMLAAADWDFLAATRDLPGDDLLRVRMNLSLTRLPHPVEFAYPMPVPEFYRSYDPEWTGMLHEFLDRYELRTISRRLADRTMWHPDRTADTGMDLSSV